MRRVRILAVIIGLSLSPVLAGDTAAQAWTQARGDYYGKFFTSYLFATEELDFQGDRQEIFASRLSVTGAWFRDVSYTGYVEYGLTDRYTIVATAPLKILTTRETQIIGPGLPPVRVTRTLGGVADLWTSLRGQILLEPIALSAQAGVKIPLGYEENPVENGQPLPPLGTAHVDGEIHVYVGKSLYPLTGYISAGIGYRLRGGRLNDEVVYNVESGYTLGPVFLKLRLDGVENTKNPPDLSSPTNNAIVGDQDWLKLNPVSSYSLTERFSIGFELFHVLVGKNTLAQTTYALSAVVTR
ncbi:MAG: hypothetical protein OEN01_00195 [Candidatus Krumholzibacteria bacterium]|nr:hypothetical protein [Candidatus Krumholzibacteria bacterium]